MKSTIRVHCSLSVVSSLRDPRVLWDFLPFPFRFPEYKPTEVPRAAWPQRKKQGRSAAIFLRAKRYGDRTIRVSANDTKDTNGLKDSWDRLTCPGGIRIMEAGWMGNAMVFIYLAENSFLTEYWLAAHPEEKAVTLIHEPAARELAETVQKQYPAVQRIVAAAEALNAGVLRTGEPADTCPLSILLPVTLDIRPLRYRPYLYMPEVLPWYPLLQRCWRWGFRKATIFNLNGSWPMDMPHLLEEFHNCYKGRRCFIAGNGPSLNAIDMTRLKDEIVFGSNQCYLGYERWGFVFPYWGISDTYQIEEYALKYGALTPPESVHFFPCEYLPLLRFSNACPVNIGLGPEAAHQFSDHPDRLYIGHTVTHMLIQIAAVMGCDPIILIGVDHRYDVKPPSFARKHLRRAHRYLIRRAQHTVPYKMTQAAYREWVKGRSNVAVESSKGFWNTNDTRIATHFDTRYTGQGGRKFRLPEPGEAELDFECARRWAESHGRRILNATPGTALHVFEKAAYDSLF